jgi:hypothetical protein
MQSKSSFLSSSVSHHIIRYCNLQRNSETLKAKWHTYHTFTHHMKNIDTYTTQTHSRARACMYSSCIQQTHTLVPTLYTQHTNAKTQAHTHSLTQKNNTHPQQQHTHTHTWTGRHPDRGAPVEGCFKAKGWEETVHTCWTKGAWFVIQSKVLVRQCSSIVVRYDILVFWRF